MLLRSTGPLKAVHTKDMPMILKERNGDPKSEKTRLSCGELKFDMDKNTSTPVIRTTSNRLRRNGSLNSSLGLRACQTDKWHLLSSLADIRQHFPIKSSVADTGKDGRTVSGIKRTADPMDMEYVTASKQARHSTSNDLKSVHLTMGAYVKTHPRYYRRHSGSDFPKSDEGDVTLNNSSCPLSPICPIPRPEEFPPRLPEFVPAPAKVKCRSTETQTSPTVPQGVQSTETPRKSRTKGPRLSAGSSQVLTGLRKTFGSLKRAISAERVAQRSGHSAGDESRACGVVVPSIQAERNATRRSSSIVVASKMADSVPQGSQEVHTAYSTDGHQLTCQVIGTYADGSHRVVLRRSSTKQQFGFFVACDSQGIYISRLGSVRSAVKLWDVFHVGDRILEVQGVSCSKLSVEDVRNLIRGCELAEFRIRPARTPLCGR